MGTAQRGQPSGDGEGCQTPPLLHRSLLTSVSRLVVSEAAKGRPGRASIDALQQGPTHPTQRCKIRVARSSSIPSAVVCERVVGTGAR